MKIGLVGLGKMGFNLGLNLLDHKHSVVAYDVSKEAVSKISKEGATGAASIRALIEKLPGKRVVWVMVPSGDATEKVIEELGKGLAKGDIIIDGGNSCFKDSLRRHDSLKKKGIDFIDCGTSGRKLRRAPRRLHDGGRGEEGGKTLRETLSGYLSRRRLLAYRESRQRSFREDGS